MFEWYLSSFLDKPNAEYALIILNQPIRHASIFQKAWDNAQLRICADGGANRLFDFTQDVITSDKDNAEKTRIHYTPDYIKGDLDSLRDDVKSYYRHRGTKIIQDDDQNSTDFGKCITLLEEKDLSYDILVAGSLSGRFDQSMSLIHHLHLLLVPADPPEGYARYKPRKCVLLTPQNLVCLLGQGSHQLSIPRAKGLTCGLIPIGGEAIVTTKGLRWNLEHSPTVFGGLVSTSNEIVGMIDHGMMEVEIETSAPIIWCEGLNVDGRGVDANATANRF